MFCCDFRVATPYTRSPCLYLRSYFFRYPSGGCGQASDDLKKKYASSPCPYIESLSHAPSVRRLHDRILFYASPARSFLLDHPCAATQHSAAPHAQTHFSNMHDTYPTQPLCTAQHARKSAASDVGGTFRSRHARWITTWHITFVRILRA